MRRDVSRGRNEARLLAAGLRVTRPRLLVYSILRDAGGHRSVDEIVSLLAARGHRIPRMSVYNVVADLSDASLLMCSDTGPGRALYEVSHRRHHHFVCRACGAVRDVPCRAGFKPCLEPPARLRAEVDESQVIYRGVCSACARAAKRRAPASTSPRPWPR
ncbi:MAG TPA: transcriptional repressor [Candidatus Eisenbacteria bacterium]|nr:transcriptional repressor [Candidatus Eisenbacteria bacterium]